MPTNRLATLLRDWHLLLQEWSAEGSVSVAPQKTLLLDGEPSLLTALIEQWSEGDFSGLPPIVLLPASSMPAAVGAYANSTGTIYINEDWLQTASQEQVLVVLTQELRHHLDNLLNAEDTPGDEGALFSALLVNSDLSTEEIEAFRSTDDSGAILVDGQEVDVEMATVTSPPIARVTAISPALSEPTELISVGGTLIFSASCTSAGREARILKPGAESATLLSDHASGIQSSNPKSFAAVTGLGTFEFKDFVYYTARNAHYTIDMLRTDLDENVQLAQNASTVNSILACNLLTGIM